MPKVKSKKCRLFIVPLIFFSQLQASAQTLWDNWYITNHQGVTESYYNEKAEIIQNRIKVQVNTWSKQNGKILSENLGAYSKNTQNLEPLLYNFRTTEGGLEKSIDGTVSSNGKVFSAKVTRGTNTSLPVKAEMIQKIILVSFFPVWINKNYKRITGVQPIEFTAIVEDQVMEKEVPVAKGTAYEMRGDEFSKQTNTRKLRIVFNNLVCFWYVTTKGDAVKILVPALEKEVVLVTKEKAQASLKP